MNDWIQQLPVIVGLKGNHLFTRIVPPLVIITINSDLTVFQLQLQIMYFYFNQSRELLTI